MAMSGGERTLPVGVQDWRLSRSATRHLHGIPPGRTMPYGVALNVLINMYEHPLVTPRSAE